MEVVECAAIDEIREGSSKIDGVLGTENPEVAARKCVRKC
jgi:hypothetical protein